MSSQSSRPSVADSSVLHLKLNYPIPELTDNTQQSQFSTAKAVTIGINEIKRQIRDAKTNDKIEGILLQTESVLLNPTSAYNITRSLEDFKSSGKFIYAYGDYFNQSGYILASCADSVFLNPNGLIDLRGYGMVVPYFKDFSDKTGVDFDVYHAGKYKSAVEPYYRSFSSDENRFQSREFLHQYHVALSRHIAQQRNLDPQSINVLIQNGLPPDSESARREELVDRLMYEEELHDLIKEKLDVRKLSLVKPELYSTVFPGKKSGSKNKVAVVYAEGVVAFAGNAKGTINMKVYKDVFDALSKNKSIEAVIIRVNSPGGSSFTSDKFWKRVTELQDKGKYVVASFGDYAASGGYYIAASADQIIAEPTTLTGSIGAYSMIPNFYDASKEKLGINWDTIGTGRQTFLYSAFVPRSERDHRLLQASTDRTYAQFKSVVSSGRGIDQDDLEDLSQGRVWSGADAQKVGLVDSLGGLELAFELVADHFDYEDYKVLEYPIIKKTFWEELITNIAANTNVSIPSTVEIPAIFSESFKEILSSVEEACFEPQLRLPFHIMIN